MAKDKGAAFIPLDGDPQIIPADVSIAKQLQQSMERNARMKNRLEKFIKAFFVSPQHPAGVALRKIMDDQDI